MVVQLFLNGQQSVAQMLSWDLPGGMSFPLSAKSHYQDQPQHCTSTKSWNQTLRNQQPRLKSQTATLPAISPVSASLPHLLLLHPPRTLVSQIPPLVNQNHIWVFRYNRACCSSVNQHMATWPRAGFSLLRATVDTMPAPLNAPSSFLAGKDSCTVYAVMLLEPHSQHPPPSCIVSRLATALPCVLVDRERSWCTYRCRCWMYWVWL